MYAGIFFFNVSEMFESKNTKFQNTSNYEINTTVNYVAFSRWNRNDVVTEYKRSGIYLHTDTVTGNRVSGFSDLYYSISKPERNNKFANI